MNKALLEMKKLIADDQYINDFIKNNNISEDVLNEAVFDLLNVSEALEVCKKCQGKGECMLGTFDTHPTLVYNNGIKVVDVGCEYKDLISPKYLELLYFPYEYTDGDLKAVNSRSELYKALKEYNTDPLHKQETLELIRAYYKIPNRQAAKHLYDLTIALSKSLYLSSKEDPVKKEKK